MPTTDQAVASGNAYELIKKRLTEQGSRLESQTAKLNQTRLDEFGNSQMQVIARTRIRTENNCVARDMVQVGDYMLFGYNVFMGMKQETHIDDVLSVYNITMATSETDGDAKTEPQLVEVAIADTFLNQPNFVSDFNELYRYYKQTQLLQLMIKDGKLLVAFQIGERVTDLRVFRFAVSADGREVTYIDNRGERDLELPPAYDFDWIETGREQMVNGKHPHMNILDTLFVETVGGDLTIKIEDNTKSGMGIYAEPVIDKTQSLTDGEIHYSKVGSLILLKILPYRETEYRYLVFNTLTESVLRLDAIGQSCVQLPEDHGIVFPGGYYLQTGEHKLFEANKEAENLQFKRRIVSPNGEDVSFLFYDINEGITGIFAYNLIKKELQNPIYCHGYALAESGQLVLFSSESEPTRIHPMQIWQTPFASDEFMSNQPENSSFYGKIGNKELVRGISDLYSVTRLINNQSVSQKLYEELSRGASKLFDNYYWLDESELSEIAGSIREVTATSELVIDEFAKVHSIQKQTKKAIADAEAKQTEILRLIRITTFETVNDFVGQLSALRHQKGHLASLENLRYLDEEKLASLVEQVNETENELAEQTVTYLSGEDALASYDTILVDIKEQLDVANTNADLTPILESIDETAQGLDLLTELLGTLDVADATVRTQIIDEISTIYSKLNQSKANLNHKRKNLGSTEAVAQFGAQFKLFSQSITNALSVANSPEKCDEQLAKLLVQLEELESQFSEFDQFLGDIISKREEIHESFENHKQQLLDERNRKAQNLGDGALRMLDSIKKRTQATGATGFTDPDALNTYFASDGLVQKVRSIGKELTELGFSVKGDDIDAQLKAIQTDSFKSLKDKSDLFESGGSVIKLGKHRFSVNTQQLDLTLLTRQTGNSVNDRVMNLHLTGTDYYEEINSDELNALRPFWDMSIASETPTVYRGEYLAYSIIESAKLGEDGLTTDTLYKAYERTLPLTPSLGAGGLPLTSGEGRGEGLDNSPLAKLIKEYTTPRYKLGYEKGIHDHDATIMLMKILPTLQNAGLLVFEPLVRTLAQLFVWQAGLGSQLGSQLGLDSLAKYPHGASHGLWLTDNKLSEIATWRDRAITAQQLQNALGSVNAERAKRLLKNDISEVMTTFVEVYGFRHLSTEGANGVVDAQSITDGHINKASEYLVEALGNSHADNMISPSLTASNSGALTSLSKIKWQTNQKAQDLTEDLKKTLDSASFEHLATAMNKLILQPKSAYELLETWFMALVASKKSGEIDNVHAKFEDASNVTDEAKEEREIALKAIELKYAQLRHYVPEAIAIMLTGQATLQSDDSMLKQTLSVFERTISAVSLEVEATGILGDHVTIIGQRLSFALDDFLSRLNTHHSEVIPAYESYLAMRTEIVHTAKSDLRLSEFMPRPLSSFVRNRLINESYLPLIGDNLAKQMGTVGDSKRTDLMGLLMMISPPGYGKTTLMEYVANRLGLIFMKINCPSLGHDVTSLDPTKAPNATAREELKKINLALEMGNNVMLYLDDIQHTHSEFLQKFISLCDGTRRMDGVWQGKTKTYDMRGKKFCVVMAGNPYTESGESFQVPDMLANRADIYNLGDILGGTEEIFALSYIENSLTSNSVLTPMANREMSDVYQLIRMAKGETVNTSELSYPYSGAEVNEITAVLQKMFVVQDVILKVNQQYIASASQDDKYRVEPVFKLQGSYRNMNKMTEKLSAVMNEEELNQLIGDHYLGESQLLTQGAESNLLKLAQMRGVMSEEQTTRWEQIKTDFLRNKAMGGDESDTGNKIVAQLVDIVTGFTAINDNMSEMTTVVANQSSPEAEAEKEQQKQLAQQTLMMAGAGVVGEKVDSIANSIDSGFENTIEKLVKLYQHDHKTENEHLRENQQLQRELMVKLVTAVEQLADNMGDSLSDSLTESMAELPIGGLSGLGSMAGQGGMIANTEEPELSQTELEENKIAEEDAQRKHMNLMSNMLKQVVNPLIMRMDEKLQIDMQTEQSGKLIVSNLQKLNQVLGELE